MKCNHFKIFKAAYAALKFIIYFLKNSLRTIFDNDDVLRDILINEIPLIFRKELYATLCILGGMVFGFCQWMGLDILWTEIISFLVIFLTRVFSVKYHIALPKIKSRVGDNAMDDFQ